MTKEEYENKRNLLDGAKNEIATKIKALDAEYKSFQSQEKHTFRIECNKLIMEVGEKTQSFILPCDESEMQNAQGFLSKLNLRTSKVRLKHSDIRVDEKYIYIYDKGMKVKFPPRKTTNKRIETDEVTHGIAVAKAEEYKIKVGDYIADCVLFFEDNDGFKSPMPTFETKRRDLEIEVKEEIHAIAKLYSIRENILVGEHIKKCVYFYENRV